MNVGKLKRMSLPVLMGYALGVLFTRTSYMWADSYAGTMVTRIPDPGFPVKLICWHILNNFGWYTLGVVALFIYVVWVWSEPYRCAEGQ